MKGFRIEFSLDSSDAIFIQVEDNGRACYAYLFIGPKIKSMVWLYNRLPAPGQFEDGRGANGPRNPRAYVVAEIFQPPKDHYEVEALCRQAEGELDASIYIRGKLSGIATRTDS